MISLDAFHIYKNRMNELLDEVDTRLREVEKLQKGIRLYAREMEAVINATM